MTGTPRLYGELAEWWPLLSAPADYAEEAQCLGDLLVQHGPSPLRTVLELGTGGGNLASHLKDRFALTLTDLSPAMLAVSRQRNPECEHLPGDMRALRLGRTFDAVLVHDAVMYLTTGEDLRAALTTAVAHLQPGGVAVFVPDFVTETFAPGVDQGGHDGEGRGLRYLEWVRDDDPADTAVEVDFAMLLREGGTTRVVHDRHRWGLFPRGDWLRWLAELGCRASTVATRWWPDVFLAVRA